MSASQPKILIVEDEPDISSTLQSYLGRRGFQVSTTASGLEALSFIDIVKPDVVILDFALNDLNGREVLRQLREKDQQTQVVIITGQMLTDDEVDGVFNFGISSYFSKPVILEKLGRVVGDLTGRDVSAVPLQAPSSNKVIQPEISFFRSDIHKLINLLGIIRNKCENFVLSRDEGIYKEKSDCEMLAMCVEILREIPEAVDTALDAVERIRQEN